MEGGLLSTEEFKEFGKSVVLFAHVTTRIEGRKYEGLLSEKGGGGFPYLAILNATGDLMASVPYSEFTIEGFKKSAETGAKYAAVLAKTDRTTEDKMFVLTHEVALGKLDHEKAKESAAALGELDDAQKKIVDGLMLGFEIKAALPQGRNPDPEAAKAAGKTFAEMWAAGREPTTDDLFQPFFILMLNHAEGEQDADLFERALGKLKAKFGDNPRAKRFFDAQDARLTKLKEAADSDESNEESTEDDEDDEDEDDDGDDEMGK